MARVPLVRVDDPHAIASGVFSTFEAEGRTPIDLYRALANTPRLLKAYRTMPQTLRHEGTTPRSLRELAVLRIAQLVGSAYEWSHHRPMALSAGISETQIRCLTEWHTATVFSPVERATLAVADSMHVMSLTDREFAVLKDHLGREGAIELVLAVAQYEATARIIQALGIDVEAEYERHLADWSHRR